jgi:hypothetical protein
MHTEDTERKWWKRLGRQREEYQPTAGPHPEPDTSRETLPGSLDVNKREQEQEQDYSVLGMLGLNPGVLQRLPQQSDQKTINKQ